MHKFNKKLLIVVAGLLILPCVPVAAEGNALKAASDGIVRGFNAVGRAVESGINAVADTMSEYYGISCAVGIPLTIWGFVKLVRFAKKCEADRLAREAAMLEKMTPVEREQYWNTKILRQQAQIAWNQSVHYRY